MKLIMRADDLGFSEAVNLGIYKAVKEGVITSVGMMTNMEHANHGYELVKDFDIALGQHTNICAGRPLTDPKLIPSLVQENGEFCSSREIRSRKEDTVVIEEAEMEIEAQYLRFKEITGKDPDYFECHAVISQKFFIALRNVAKKYGLFYENVLFNQEFEKENNIYGIAMAKLNEQMLYDPKEYIENSLEFIRNHDVSVMVFHPGYLDQYILTHSSFTLIRAMECDFLCSSWLKDWLNEYQIERLKMHRFSLVKDDPLYIDYHDLEWGKPVYDDQKLYEMFLLETFQAGLSWECVLNKREDFRKAFDNFDVTKVSEYDEEKINALLENKDIIRSRGKITAAINNAKIFIEIQKEFGSFSNYIWGFTDNKVIKNTTGEIPVKTELSDMVSKDLKKRGMKYTGSVIIYSYLQAVGVVNDHDINCYKY